MSDLADLSTASEVRNLVASTEVLDLVTLTDSSESELLFLLAWTDLEDSEPEPEPDEDDELGERRLERFFFDFDFLCLRLGGADEEDELEVRRRVLLDRRERLPGDGDRDDE